MGKTTEVVFSKTITKKVDVGGCIVHQHLPLQDTAHCHVARIPMTHLGHLEGKSGPPAWQDKR